MRKRVSPILPDVDQFTQLGPGNAFVLCRQKLHLESLQFHDSVQSALNGYFTLKGSQHFDFSQI